MADNQKVTIPENFNPNDFWQLWQEYRDYLYARCLKWMGGNPIEAEDALSRAMLKAWEKVQQYAGKITNLKAWLTRLTHNLCVDIHREHSRRVNRVEDIEAISEEKKLVSREATPLKALENEEKQMAIRGAIDNLPIKLRQTFVLHLDYQLSHKEIAQKQDISYANVCKRLSQARKILREELRKHFIYEYETDKKKSNQTEDVLIESNTSMSFVGDRNQKEVISNQSSASLSLERKNERNEKLLNINVKFESFVSKNVSKQISEENDQEKKGELFEHKKFLVSQQEENNRRNFHQLHISPLWKPAYHKLITARNMPALGCISQEKRMKVVDALSRVMAKQRKKEHQYAGKIRNLKVRLKKLTHNVCVDIHREHSCDANRVEDIKAIPEEKELISCEDTPLRASEIEEKKMAIRGAIKNLPKLYHETFILHLNQQLSPQVFPEELVSGGSHTTGWKNVVIEHNHEGYR